jgi:uncharacterized protein (DUF302 family)
VQQEIGFEVILAQPFDQALEKVIAALKVEGFGVLTRIDVKATLKEKLDQDFRLYVILGACNPPLAHRALSAHAEIGLMLPCNVTIEETENGASLARIANPEVMMQVAGLENSTELIAVAQEARARLERVAHTLAQP